MFENHATVILYLDNTMQEEFKNEINEGGIFYIFENHTQENTHINPQVIVFVCHRLIV